MGSTSHNRPSGSVALSPRGEQVIKSLTRQRDGGNRADCDLSADAAVTEHAWHLLDKLYLRAVAATSIDGYRAQRYFAIFIYADDGPQLRC